MTFFSRNCCVLNVLVFSDEIHGETIFVNLNEKKYKKILKIIQDYHLLN